jgi:hypothetical protein
MSGPGDEDQEPAPFISIAAGETFDGRERMFSRAAFNLHVQACRYAAEYGQPGWVPDGYLARLEGRGTETVITAAELCALGIWERAGGGYRILDWEGVEYALDGVRERRGQDLRALAEEHDHEARAWAFMARPMVVTPPCAACGNPAARVEIVPPGQLPAGWDQQPGTAPGRRVQEPDPEQWYLLRHGIAADGSYGRAVPGTAAGQLAWALRSPLRYAQVRTAGFRDDVGFCPGCEVPYCCRHWHLAGTGYGHCPYGHPRDLDPRWSP